MPLPENLLTTQKPAFEGQTDIDRAAQTTFCQDYIAFLDEAKTERDAVAEAVRRAEAAGFRSLDQNPHPKAGDKVYRVHFGRALSLAVVGKAPLSAGARFVAAHIDSPRIDLKPNPLQEKEGLAYFKTHYYGGIKKYQWLTIPLELRGVVVKTDGETVPVRIGADADDPVLVITDVLPHLGASQVEKTVGKAFPGENLMPLVGLYSLPSEDGKKEDGKDPKADRDGVKRAVMAELHRRYGMVEADFTSAELSLVPAANARFVGLDKAFLGGYGQDDRVCAFTALRAILETDDPEHTAICFLADKEEIGSEGVSGLESACFDTFVHDLCDAQGVDLRRCYPNSLCLSTDVCNGYDPLFAEVSDLSNNARVGYGLGLVKYTGSRGKAGASDAPAEVVAAVRRILDKANVPYQFAELGKVDEGGGGTVAAYLARRELPVIDAGVPVLSMHAPYEVTACVDVYMAYKGFSAFLKD